MVKNGNFDTIEKSAAYTFSVLSLLLGVFIGWFICQPPLERLLINSLLTKGYSSVVIDYHTKADCKKEDTQAFAFTALNPKKERVVGSFCVDIRAIIK